MAAMRSVWLGVILGLCAFAWTGPPLLAEEGAPDLDKQEWLRTHPWFAKMGYPERCLTTTARTCIDSTVRKANGLIDGEALRKCINLGCREESERKTTERRRAIQEHQPEAIKKWLGALLGYRVALAQDKREAAKAEIAKEKKYSRVGGVVNKVAIHEAQQEIRSADEIIETQQASAKTNQVKVLRRDDPKVDRVQECMDANHDPKRSAEITVQDIDDVVQAATSFEVEGQDCLWILLLLRATEPQ